MATNEILKFAESATNILSQGDYDTDPQRDEGVSGIARSALNNKTQKQTSTVAAGVSQFIADNQSEDVTDDLTPEEYAALFDSTLRIGSSKDILVIDTNTVLTYLDVGKTIYFDANSLTLTLPDPGTVNQGSKIYVNGDGHTGNVIEGDIVNGVLGDVLSMSLEPRDTIIFSRADDGWFCEAGSAQLKQSSSFQHLFQTPNTLSGYQKLPSGLILQWGSGVTDMTGIVTGSFNIAFPSIVYSFIAQVQSSSLSGLIVGGVATSLSAWSMHAGIYRYGIITGELTFEPEADVTIHYLAVGA
jgi:hypothetical protein